MKTFTIVLLAILANLLLLVGILVLTNVQNLHHLSAVNWLTFVPIAFGYALIVGLLGLLFGGTVNGLLVYPKHKFRNYSVSQVNTGVLCLLLVVYFAWSTGSFTYVSQNPHGLTHSWFHADLLYRDIADKGFKAF